MKQARWKRFLSYFFEFHIESTSSDHNPHMYVSLNRGRYQLCTANAVYSHEDLYDNFTRAFQQIKLDQLDIQNVLVLGFGLGSIPQMLEKVFNKQYHYTAIEIDEQVLYLAHKYILPDLKSGMNLICSDAYAYVMQTTEQFDMITVDVFLDDEIPEVFQSIDFLEKAKSLLSPNGILLYNCLAYTEKDRALSQTFFDQKFTKAFPDGHLLSVKDNWMLLNRSDIL